MILQNCVVWGAIPKQKLNNKSCFNLCLDKARETGSRMYPGKILGKFLLELEIFLLDKSSEHRHVHC